jgi:hypothetical protein
MVMLSLFTAFVVTSLMYQGRIQNGIEETLITNGKKIVQAYVSTPFMLNAGQLSARLPVASLAIAPLRETGLI